MASQSKKTVVVGMSGGVDSSVAALLLKRQGYNVIGLFMYNWDDEGEKGPCSAQEDYVDVAKTSSVLDIPYFSVDFRKEYKKLVFTPFLEDYKKGLTPNPDILCNKEIKFNFFYEKAMSLGADYLATGHYCRLEGGKLLKACDQNKDQTYFLHAVKKNILPKVLFPLGALQKSEVRALAEKAGLPTYKKKDSTGICFIGERNFRNFLQNYIPPQPGDFQSLDGKLVGQHQGTSFYTLGQRKHLGLGGPGKRWFVVKKDQSKNIVYVERDENHPELYTDSLTAYHLNWLVDPPKSFPFSCMAKVRYRQKDQKVVIESVEGGVVKVRFYEAQRAVAEKQSIVFYKENICFGGATIVQVGESIYEKNKKNLA